MINEALKQIARVQKIDSAALELQRRFAHIDPGKHAHEEYAAAKAALDEAESLYKAVRTELEDLELANKGFEQKAEAEKKRLYSGGVYNAKDAENIDREIASLMKRRSQNDDRILELWDLVEPAKQKAAEAKAEFDKAEAKLKEYEAKYAAIKAEFEAKLAQVQALRQKEIVGCDPKLLAKYDAMRQKRGGVGLSAVVEGVCSACQTAIPKKQLGDIEMGETLETCENCLRYLYIESQS
jgi:predicted  nucleic acid-binding Zn-ribbon protein